MKHLVEWCWWEHGLAQEEKLWYDHLKEEKGVIIYAGHTSVAAAGDTVKTSVHR